VPPESLLRSQLVVADVASKEVSRSLVLPAMVESDPARTVKVMPPSPDASLSSRSSWASVSLRAGACHHRFWRLGASLFGWGESTILRYVDQEGPRSTLGLQKIGGGRSRSASKRRATTHRPFGTGPRSNAAAVDWCLGEQMPKAGFSPSRRRSREPDRSANRSRCVPQRYDRAAMTIANLETIWVTANVPEKDISFVFTGRP